MDYLGRIITKNPTAPTVGSAKGIWTLDEAMQYQKAGTWPLPQYPFSRSVRTRASASAYLSWTPSASATSTQKLTYSAWIKRGTLGSVQHFGLNAAISGSARDAIRFTTSDALEIFLNEASSAYLATTQLFRDPSAWYHIVVAVDTTQATSSDRIKVYVNGVQVTAFSTSTYPTQNYNFTGWLVSGKVQNLARSPEPNYYFDGYMTGVNVVDGQQLAPTSFGAFDATTGVWNPTVYTGTYGTNGFFLSFSDPTSTTTLSQDYSGNANNWTANNISLTSGVTYDSMVDTTSNSGTDTGVGGTVRGNYATLNPISNGTAAYVKAGNLQINPSDGNFQPSLSTIGVSSGKWYAECTITNIGSGFMVGIGQLPSTLVATNYLGNTATSWGYYGDPFSNSRLYNNSSYTSYGSAYTTGSVISIALDMDAGTLVFYRNGVGQGTATTGLSGTYAIGASPAGAAGIADMNYGQRQFVYTAPSGYKALCTQNLPTATVSNGANYMAATLYTGNGSTQSITNTVNGISFQPDFTWFKNRSGANNHALYDSVRGRALGLKSNDSGAEETASAGNDLVSFNSNGVSLGPVEDYTSVNGSGQSIVLWNWKASGSTVSNTTGSITSTVNANTTAGFSILTYTGNGTVGATVGHGLGATPGMVIVKSRSAVANWPVKILPYMAGGSRLELDTTNAITTESAGSGSLWNATNPNSTVITLGNQAMTNTNGTTYVAYCFAPITGYSAFGSYVGNGSTDGTFVYCGFRPRWILAKSTSTGYWHMFDSSRPTYNPETLVIYANIADAEATVAGLDFLSNGFKLRYGNAGINGSGDTILYAAFAENPFTLARAR